ncbi:MAG: hypothetical protein WAS27_04610 [Candidatus Saccharimonadales bacterium]
MNSSGAQRIIPAILVLIVIIVAIAALVSVGRSIFGGPSQEVVNTGRESLLNTSLDRSVRMTVRGPIVGDDQFHTYVMTITPTTRNLTTYQGYLRTQLETTDLANNSKGYEQFVYALDRANMMAGDELEGEADDTRGICAQGIMYQYQVLQGTNVIKTLWTTSCSKSRGSLRAVNQTLLRLFRAQTPDTAKMTRKINL